MPSVRTIMARLHVSPVTVRQAMAQLSNEGVIATRPGHGTFVAGAPPLATPLEADYAWQGIALGAARVPAEAVGSLLAVAPPGAINLAGGYPSEELQATGLASQALIRAARRPGVWGRMPVEGLEGLRSWFAQQIGAMVSSHEVLICPGSQSALATIFGALTSPGATVLIESPSYLGAIVAARASGLNLVPVPIDAHGVKPEMLAQAFATTRARLFYCQPSCANPSGATLPSDRRRNVLEIVETAKAIVIEDDWCRDLSFEKSPARPLISYDRHGHVVYVRSITKSSTPGLRIGAIVARGALLSRIRASRAISDFFVSGLLQEAALELVYSPAWARHLRDLRETLRFRRDALVAAVQRHLGRESVSVVPEGGMHLWVRLKDPVDDALLASRAAELGVLVTPGGPWFPAEPTGSYLRLSWACASPAQMERALETIARLVATLSRPALKTHARQAHRRRSRER